VLPNGNSYNFPMSKSWPYWSSSILWSHLYKLYRHWTVSHVVSKRHKLFIRLQGDTYRIEDCIGYPCFFCSPRNAWATEETWISNTISYHRITFRVYSCSTFFL
jgi:hypothetical protein